MEYKILSEQMVLQEYVDDKRLTEPLRNALMDSNECHVS